MLFNDFLCFFILYLSCHAFCASLYCISHVMLFVLLYTVFVMLCFLCFFILYLSCYAFCASLYCICHVMLFNDFMPPFINKLSYS